MIALTVPMLACKFPELPPITETDAETDAATDAGPVDVPIECTPSTTTCTGSTLVVCDAAGVATVSTCGFGCASSNDRCSDLAPSNGLGTYLDQSATAQPLTLTGNASIDTTSGTVTNGDGSNVVVTSTMLPTTPVPLMVVSVRSLDVGNVTVRGTRALAILVDGNATFHGTFSANATSFTPGPGSSLLVECDAGNGSANTNGGSGSGGGGFGGLGGSGGNGGGGTVGGGGGSVRGDTTLVPLRTGCPGGVPNAMPSDTYRREGGGGGAIQVSARGRITIGPGAFLSANGGGAKSYTDSFLFTCQTTTGQPQTCHQGAGGGAGGGILVEASSIQIATSGGFVANGGAGHCGSHGQAPDGALSETPAPGSSCTAYTAVGNGGSGAGGTTIPAAGGSATGQNGQGGGGGGGPGRIRINLPTGTTVDPGPPVISPLPSLGIAATR